MSPKRILDRPRLVLGLGIGEPRGEFLVDALLRLRCASPGRNCALGSDTDQLASDLADALA